jgi:hypothetical protein
MPAPTARLRRFRSSLDDVRSMYKVLPIDNKVVASVKLGMIPCDQDLKGSASEGKA